MYFLLPLEKIEYHAAIRNTSIHTLYTGGRPDFDARHISAQAGAMVDAVLLPKLDKRHVAHHGANLLGRQGAFLRHAQSHFPAR